MQVFLWGQVFLSGLGLGFSLIVAIGAQNAFVLRQGLRNEHVFWVCLVCAVSDAVLMLVGVLFFDQIAGLLPWLDNGLRIAGAIYLAYYALGRFKAAFHNSSALEMASGVSASIGHTLVSVALLTWLNPHVYIDTVMLVGSVASGFGDERWVFAAGAISASFVFFFLLGFGAKRMGGWLNRPHAWRILDATIGALLVLITLQLLHPLLSGL